MTIRRIDEKAENSEFTQEKILSTLALLFETVKQFIPLGCHVRSLSQGTLLNINQTRKYSLVKRKSNLFFNFDGDVY